MAITNERIRSILSSQATYQERFIVQALMELLESQVGAGTTDDIIDSFLPVSPTQQAVMFGRKLGDYSGLSRTKIKALFTKPDGSALDNDDVDDIFAALGVVTGTSAPNPLGGTAPSQAAGVPKAPKLVKEVAKPKAEK